MLLFGLSYESLHCLFGLLFLLFLCILFMSSMSLTRFCYCASLRTGVRWAIAFFLIYLIYCFILWIWLTIIKRYRLYDEDDLFPGLVIQYSALLTWIIIVMLVIVVLCLVMGLMKFFPGFFVAAIAFIVLVILFDLIAVILRGLYWSPLAFLELIFIFISIYFIVALLSYCKDVEKQLLKSVVSKHFSAEYRFE